MATSNTTLITFNGKAYYNTHKERIISDLGKNIIIRKYYYKKILL